MGFFKNNEILRLAKADRVLVGFCLICVLSGSLVFFNEKLSQMVFGAAAEDTSRPLLGRLSRFENDARHKNPTSFTWDRARRDQSIRLNDSVFTGEQSSAQVTLDKGSRVDLGQNTMLVFREVQGVNLPDFTIGNFRFDVDGKVTVAVQGKITEIAGQSSEVQVYLGKDRKPQIRVLKGRVSFRENDRPEKTLDANEFVSFGGPTPDRVAASVAPEAPAPVEVLSSDENNFVYTRRLYDVFEWRDGGLILRETPPEKLPIRRPLHWQAQRGSEIQKRVPVRGEISPVPDFSRSVPTLESRDGSAVDSQEVFPGDNYWRVSLDGKNWTETMHFRVEERDLDKSVRLYRAEQGSLVLAAGAAATSLGFQPSSEMGGYVLEASDNPEFRAGATQAYWTTKGVVGLAFNKPGRFYYRVRGVNAATELTPPSNVEEIVVESPLPLRLARAAASPHEVRRQRGATQSPRAQVPGRGPASIATSSVKASDAGAGSLNQGYSSSKLEFESGAFTVFSPDEASLGRKNPMALMLGLRSHHWFGDSGIEASVRVKVADGNDTAREINPLQVEGRYLYQIHPGFLGSTQTALIGGYEMYRNIGRGYFSQKYDLAKVGVLVDFPVRDRWDMGGEVLYGLGADRSRKYEMAGRLNYYLRKDWSLGVGYRVYFFEAGSLDSAPRELPYRETFGEGYSALRWHY